MIACAEQSLSTGGIIATLVILALFVAGVVKLAFTGDDDD